MFRLPSLLIALLVIAAGVTVLGDVTPVLPGDPQQVGTIVDVSTRDGAITSVLVHGRGSDRPGEPELFWITIDSKTRIGRIDGGRTVACDPSELAQGRKVSVWFDGPVLLSYPGKGHAAAILIQ